jgi:hypothetical protein
METNAIAKVIEQVSRLIVTKEIETLLSSDLIKDYSVEDVLRAINDYPENLHLPTVQSKYLEFRFYSLDDKSIQVEFELWANQTPSDLTVILEINDEDSNLNYHLKEIRVM